MRRACLGLLIWAVATTAVTQQSPLELTQLMTMLASVEHSSVAFEETRHLAVLTAPIIRRGTMNYVRPNRLEMQVVTPFPEKLEVVGTRVRIATSESTREWDLAAQPVALAWIDALRASLAGDVATLARLFRITLTGTSANWELRLEPQDSRVAASLSSVDLHGRQAQIVSVDIIDRQGDRIALRLTPLERTPP
jgi:hypothetical protein